MLNILLCQNLVLHLQVSSNPNFVFMYADNLSKRILLTDTSTEPTDAQLNMIMEDAISDVNAQNQVWVDKWDDFNAHIMKCMKEGAKYGMH